MNPEPVTIFKAIITMMKNEEPSGGTIHSQDCECIELEASVHLLRYKSAWIDKWVLLVTMRNALLYEG